MNQLDGRRKESLEPSWFFSMKWSSSELLRLQLKTSAPRANPSSCHCPDTMNNYWELFWIKGGAFSFVPVSRVAWFGKSFHGTTSTPSWSSVCIFKSQLSTYPDLSPGKTGFASTSVYQLRKKQNALLLDFFFLSLTAKCQPCKHFFNASNQSTHRGVPATPSRAERNMTFRNHSWYIHPPRQLNILCSIHWSNIFSLKQAIQPLADLCKMSFLSSLWLVLLSYFLSFKK